MSDMRKLLNLMEAEAPEKEYQAAQDQIWEFTKKLSQITGYAKQQKNMALHKKLKKVEALLDDIRSDLHPLRSGS